MNTISFDKLGNCIISVTSKPEHISFLTDAMFSYTAKDLNADIMNCHDQSLKSTLVRFLKDLEAGRFDFMDYVWNIENYNEDVTPSNNSCEIEILPDDRRDGKWMALVHDVHAEHSGFWYAAMNISREIQSIKKHIHILSGYLVVAENINELIELIKSADSQEYAYGKLLERGLSDLQSRAILEYRLTMLPLLEKEQLTSEISNCNRLIEILKEYM